MAPTGVQLAEQILNDLSCPQCEYNLRGLRGPIVHCPECGVECDIPRMLANQWTRPWYEVPGFSSLLMPLALLAMSVFPLAGICLAEVKGNHGSGAITLGAALTVAVVWAGLMFRADRRLPGGAGLRLAVLAHALFAGYVFALVAIAWSVIRALIQLQVSTLIATALVVPLMCALFALCRRGERHIASQCAKHYVLSRQNPGGDRSVESIPS